MANQINFYRVLAVLFIAMKLAGFFPWAWWWAFTPLFLAAALEIAATLKPTQG